MKTALALAGLLALAAPAGWALTLDLPAKAELRAEKTSALGSYRFPVGPWQDGGFRTVRAEGPVLIRAWRIDRRDLTTLQVLADLRAQLDAKGFTPLYECDTRACGGFDFRYHLQVLPEPQMHVDLGDFRYLVTRRQADTGPQYVGLLVSRSVDSRFVEVIRVGLPLPAAAKDSAAIQSSPAAGTPPAAKPPPPPRDVAGGLAAGIAVPLDDLDFPSGSSDLAPGEYGSLRAIADYMKAHPDQHITLVGHTDTTGGLEPNLALSKKRAESVRDRLIKDYGVNPAEIAAAGVGYLAPRASNDTKAGRERNRRVEAMVDSGQ